ncbi:DUF397 domain-containing protein [Kitasatospora sp. NPDC008115]|uniref:DUF397 domain-containing protein n=1 Tax=Kitasatospora sp. NPDC008115 TaxID=3364022 RepID=UPI0036E43D37
MPVRDSKDPDGPALLFPSDAWQSFVTAVRTGEFDRRCPGRPPEWEVGGADFPLRAFTSVRLRDLHDEVGIDERGLLPPRDLIHRGQ